MANQWSNDESRNGHARYSAGKGRRKSERRGSARCAAKTHSSFGLRHSFVIRHWSFAITAAALFALSVSSCALIEHPSSLIHDPYTLLRDSYGILREALRTSPEPAAEGVHSNGTFRRFNGVGVLTVWGTPYERGFAHGRLLAPAILDMLDAVCGSSLLLSDGRDYERDIVPLMSRFAFEPDDEAELRGIYDGMRATLGADVVFRALRRPLTFRDLQAYNTVADWYRSGCASFAAWGSRTQDGHVWVGRNFEFLPAKAFFTHQMFLVQRPLGKKKAWASVAAPGLIGCITGINEDGVFVAMHNAFLPPTPLKRGYSPRLLALRRLMETCGPANLEADAVRVLETRKQMFHSCVFLAAPVRDGASPAIVIEYSSDRTCDKGVTARRPEDNEPELSREILACVNQFYKRLVSPPDMASYRYPKMRGILMEGTEGDGKVDFDLARRTMLAVRLPITVHTVIANLNTLEYWFAAGGFLSPPGEDDFVTLPVREWLVAGTTPPESNCGER